MVKSAPKKPKAAKTGSHLSALPKEKEVCTAVAVADFLGVAVPRKVTSYRVSELILGMIDSLKMQTHNLITVLLLLISADEEKKKQISSLKAENLLISKKYSEAETQIMILLARADAMGIDLTQDLISAASTESRAELATTQVGQDSQDSQWASKRSRRSSRNAKQGEAA
jgi:hypothetical protein